MTTKKKVVSRALDRKTINEARSAAIRAAALEEIIIDRIDYIIKKIVETFGLKLGCWYFPNAPEGEVGNLWTYYDDVNINVETECSSAPHLPPLKSMIIIDKDGDEWEFDSFIPTRWLFDQNFETELTEGKILYEKSEAERKQKELDEKAAKTQREEELVAAAKQKLSKEELVALKKQLLSKK